MLGKTLAKIHPMKIKIGMFAPTKEQYKATGTDGSPSPGTQTQNLNEKEGKLLPFSPNRVGLSNVGSGAPERTWSFTLSRPAQSLQSRPAHLSAHPALTLRFRCSQAVASNAKALAPFKSGDPNTKKQKPPGWVVFVFVVPAAR